MKNEKLDTFASHKWVKDSFLTDCDHATNQFLFMAVLFGLSLFDIVAVVVGYYVVNNLGTF